MVGFLKTLKTQTSDCVDNKLGVFVISGLLLCSDHPDKLARSGAEEKLGTNSTNWAFIQSIRKSGEAR